MQNSIVPMAVSEVNEYARRILASDPLLRSIEVAGEITAYKNHFSGHRYFSLKDEHARVDCVMFRQNAMRLDFVPQDGMRVIINCSASIYAETGKFQLYVNSMRRAGIGELYIRFEQLKQKLSAEGLFDPARKKMIPYFPTKIGVVTSETGAAIHDIINVAHKRNPNIGIILAPCQVQGAGAAESIANAIELLNRYTDCDVLLVGRGGGSIEDLWAFNEEIVARAIAASEIPIISCVGHEVDYTIADFVADLRAPTPSAAAEQAVPVLADLHYTLHLLILRLAGALQRGADVRRLQFEKVCATQAIANAEKLLIEGRRSELTLLAKRLNVCADNITKKSKERLNVLSSEIRALDPLSVLSRGFAIVRNGDGKIITNVEDASLNMPIDIRLNNGSIRATVTASRKETDQP